VISIAVGSVLTAHVSDHLDRKSSSSLEAPLVISRRSEDEEEKSGEKVEYIPSSKFDDDSSERSAIRTYLWSTLLAQAGVAMGLAIEVQGDFPWGDKFSNVVLSVIVLNQVIGPVLCKFGLQKMMDATGHKDENEELQENENLRKLSISDKRWSCPPQTSLSSLIESSNNASSVTSPSVLRRKIHIKHVPSGSAYSSLLTPKHRNRKRSNIMTKNRSQSMLDPETPSVLGDEM
jgi:hypothetical protein